MQEGWQAFHNEKNDNCENSKEVKDYDQKQEAPEVAGRKANVHHHGPQNFWQLCMSQTEGPKPKIGGSIGDTAQAVLYGVDRLMHCHIRKVKLLVRDTTSKRISYAYQRELLENNLSTTGPEVHIGESLVHCVCIII